MAECCGIVPIPRTLWQRKQHAIQREVKSIFKPTDMMKDDDIENVIFAITEDNYCPFLSQDLECAIYEDRPELCRKFGDESHPLMCCPMQDKEGKEIE